jgi:dihydrofolate reductase
VASAWVDAECLRSLILAEADVPGSRRLVDRDVLLHGAEAARSLLHAGELDEMCLQIIPVLLGQGRRLFDDFRVRSAEELHDRV